MINLTASVGLADLTMRTGLIRSGWRVDKTFCRATSFARGVIMKTVTLVSFAELGTIFGVFMAPLRASN